MSNLNFSTIPSSDEVILYLELTEIPAEQWNSVLRIICLEGFTPQIKITGSAHYSELVAVLYQGKDDPAMTEAFHKLNALIDIPSVLIMARGAKAR